MNKFWTKQEITLLQKTYLYHTKNWLIKKFKRSWPALRHKASRLQLTYGRQYSKEELKLIKNKKLTATEVSKQTGRDVWAIRGSRRHMGITYFKSVKYSKADIQFLLNNKNISIDSLAKKLHRTKHAIRYKRRDLNIISKIPSSFEEDVAEILTDNHISFVRQAYCRPFHIDFVVNKNIALECNGTYWHADPRVYKQNTKNQLLQYAIERDKRKLKLLTKYYKKVIILWQKDFYVNPNILLTLIKRPPNRTNTIIVNSAKSVKA